jgi:hypothetical protein
MRYHEAPVMTAWAIGEVWQELKERWGRSNRNIKGDREACEDASAGRDCDLSRVLQPEPCQRCQ